MTDRHLTVLGCGYSARRFLALHGAEFASVAATVRTAEGAASAAVLGCETIMLDGGGPAALRLALSRATHVLASIPPGPGGDPGLALVRGSPTPELGWIGYLSTLGVYGDAGGGWVDERTAPDPSEPRGQRRIAAEQAWTDLGAERGAAVQLFRLAGIYGPGRNAIAQLRAGTARRIVKPGQVFNRIHVDDIAAALAAGIARPERPGPGNVCDDEPAPPQDVVAYAAGLLGVPPPPEIAFADTDLSPMARSFYASNKRVSNRRLKEAFGAVLTYPTYREGLSGLLRAGAA